MEPNAAQSFFSRLWDDYSRITPQANAIKQLLHECGERFRNDHVAIRTFGMPGIDIEHLESFFTELGYVGTGEYQFETKKLFAKSYSHPSNELPRVFISELIMNKCSTKLNACVRTLIERLPLPLDAQSLLTQQALWPTVEYDVYQTLLKESEYAAWVAAFGIRANHFTVNADDLQGFKDLTELNNFLVEHGFALNHPESPVHGSPEELLEQSSTRADEILWSFENGEKRRIRSCYYEFCKRYTDPKSGKLYDGFIPESADKIFESTNVR
ncbi:MAG: DUF1338 domain-containing protein [Myxococcales bacterium]|nr:MAG: DUF1338 domain-containing protein [Myxococcales bacterium]